MSSSEESLPLSQETFHCLWTCLNKNDSTKDEISTDAIINLIENPSEIFPMLAVDPGFLNENLCDMEEQAIIPEVTTLSSFNMPTSSSHQNISINILPKNNETLASQQIPHGNIPANNDWAGEYGFDISFGSQEKTTTRCTNWTYSDIKKKLYVNIAIPCPIRFHVLKTPPQGCIIRALPIFSKAEHIMDVVKRCLNHSLPTDPLNEGHPAPDHLIRCDDDYTEYTQDLSTGRLSITVPYKSPQVGMEYSTYLYRFMCLGSCVGGLNRRPLQLSFTLEKEDGCCLGRKIIDVRICACPGRDRRIEEKYLEKAENDTNKRNFSRNVQENNFSDQASALKKQKSCTSDDDYVLISIKRIHYDLIKKTLDGLDVLEMLTPEMKTVLHQKRMQRVVATGKKHKKGSSSEDEIV